MRLFVDCAGVRSFVAIECGDFFASHLLRAGKEAEHIAGALAELLALAGGKYADIRQICVHTGPGSFTGVRIAMAFALGTARACGSVLFGMHGFSRLAAQTPLSSRPMTTFIGAGRGQLYAARSSEGGCLASFDVISECDAARYASDALVLADERAAEVLSRYGLPCLSPHLGAVATKNAFRVLGEEACAFAPFYVRPPDAKPQAPFSPTGKECYA
ncbi:MAG: tRNA (adenosine(37)-N6)-threonylcarbamoyltransferase complex dimerization subunit type 1 TsaB [Rickettsiales bacterium]